MNNLFVLLLKYLNTIKYLRWQQIVFRILRFSSKSIDQSKGFKVREVKDTWTIPALRKSEIKDEKTFTFLNEEKKVIDENDWNNKDWPKLWLYNLHYFNDLNSYNAKSNSKVYKKLIDRWISENPIGSGNGWEPYPISLRAVNWIKWSLSGNEMEDHWNYSLLLQGRYLFKNIEYHLLANHLFSNAKALIFMGLYFQGSEADKFYKKGLKIFLREIDEQILDDGGNFELSTMYHMIFLEDLLDLVNLHRTYKSDLTNEAIKLIQKMWRWLNIMTHPDGKISFFNDAAFGITPSIQEMQHYTDRLSIDTGLDISDKVTTLESSGYARVQNDDMVAIIDIAPIGPDYQPSHAHADTFSFELSIFNQRVIVNSGISTYQDNEDRRLQRGTSSHSTLMIDSQDSSEVWGSFRVARRARIIQKKISKENNEVIITSKHDGYRRLKGEPLHMRKWTIGDDYMEICDEVTGRSDHQIEIIFPIHPKVGIGELTQNNVDLICNERIINFQCYGKGELIKRDSKYYPEFGKSIDNNRLVYILADELPIFSKFRIEW